MKRLTGLIASAAIVTGALASGSSHGSDSGRRPPPASISIAVNGLTCNTAVGAGAFSVRSWAWGAANETNGSTGSGGGAGKTTVSNLTVKKAFDNCSGPLFRAVTTGRVSRDLVLTQRDAGGNIVALVELTDVGVTSWTVGASVRDAVPDETVAFSFASVCITSAGATRQCFDLRS